MDVIIRMLKYEIDIVLTKLSNDEIDVYKIKGMMKSTKYIHMRSRYI